KFGSDFSSSSGPGLEVFLSTTNTVGANSRNLGRLQSTSGAQNYNVPSGIAFNTYSWVIIHCVPFNVTFGYAQLR
ncbi:MAG: DM13 domain-containing protein, partial [bacterium]